MSLFWRSFPRGPQRCLAICLAGANAGLKWALEQMEVIKAHVPEIGYADLFQLASVVAVEFTGGPVIPFRYVAGCQALDQDLRSFVA
jgi:catalase (peroxidase I)